MRNACALNPVRGMVSTSSTMCGIVRLRPAPGVNTSTVRKPYLLLLLPVIIVLVSNGTAGRPVDATKLRNRPSDCETYVEMLARMSATAQVEYYKYHGLAVPGAVVSVKAVSRYYVY